MIEAQAHKVRENLDKVRKEYEDCEESVIRLKNSVRSTIEHREKLAEKIRELMAVEDIE